MLQSSCDLESRSREIRNCFSLTNKWLTFLAARTEAALAFEQAKLSRIRKQGKMVSRLNEVRIRKKGDSTKYRHMVLLSAPVMIEALGPAEGTLWSSSIKVRKYVMEEWEVESRNWNSIKISSSRIVGSIPRYIKLRALWRETSVFEHQGKYGIVHLGRHRDDDY
ncbi:hypothetical protein PVK06_042720 [Gossypium arboreum]|uniref:Uncharacterized protein n=1 Tax=Gossypium arboreum TaxID=29729 RepID=A0ABR0MM13_GOSAR|nr:hypothetical protein PVK06_042720 [Gossypium arboreum]